MITGYKIFAHDWSPPIQRGTPVIDGRLPVTLPRVELDRSDEECGVGWNFCATATQAIIQGGLWRSGRPSHLVRVESAEADTVERGKKLCSAALTVLGEEDLIPHVRTLAQAFGVHADAMIAAQVDWLTALARPDRDAESVEIALGQALVARGLAGWTIRRFPDARDARAARDASWDACWNARAARDASWDACWNDGNAWAAALAVRASWAAAWDARDALTVHFAALRGWAQVRPEILTIGILDAYRSGAEIVLPVGPATLGWAMAK